jgi:predicted nucleotidyltransferase
MADPDLIRVLSDTLAAPSNGARIRVALLFGSAAQGSLRRESDVDVGIVPADPAMPLHEELMLQGALTRATGRSVDLVRLDRADGLVRWEAARCGLVLFSLLPGAAARFLADVALEHADAAPLVEAGAERWRRAVLAGAGTAE